VWMTYASLFSKGISLVLFIVTKLGTVGFLNTDIRLMPMLVMHAVLTLE